MMTRDRTTLPVNARFLQIGLEVIPVYGNDQCGWTLDAEDLPTESSSSRFRYGSLDELFFVLINMNIAYEGTA